MYLRSLETSCPNRINSKLLEVLFSLIVDVVTPSLVVQTQTARPFWRTSRSCGFGGVFCDGEIGRGFFVEERKKLAVGDVFMLLVLCILLSRMHVLNPNMSRLQVIRL
ncbi:hypothetical protein Rs2_27595 [Raphanus sativus]|nr:hypothetical protein Rs2_27595 [Raphanus sativus]